MRDQLSEAIRPITESPLSLSEQRQILNKMYALAMSNIPDNETDNFTARMISPVYLALAEMLEKLPE